MNDLIHSATYQDLLEQISDTYATGRSAAFAAANIQLLKTYWSVGRQIVEFEQGGKDRAEYGAGLIDRLSADLCFRHGRSFNRSNLVYMRLFYLRYSIGETPSHQLSWSHYVELLKLDDPLERGSYEQQATAERWSVAELKRQRASALFLRLAASKDKAGILDLARRGQAVSQPEDLLREPYVFEFKKIPEPWRVSETELEAALCQNLQQFLLELGKGFTFVGRQYRITVNNVHYKVDLVFYHRILRCFVLIDLKIGDVQHQDIGQMNLYLGYFAKEENTPDD
jgi:predicted nuclease of restriction endonuclease-like (RecB) superfamily